MTSFLVVQARINPEKAVATHTEIPSRILPDIPLCILPESRSGFSPRIPIRISELKK